MTNKAFKIFSRYYLVIIVALLNVGCSHKKVGALSKSHPDIVSFQNDFAHLQRELPVLQKKNLLFLAPVPVANYGDREGKKVSMVIVHHTGISTLKDTKELLNKIGLSAHFIVDKDGSITLTVPLEKRAYHAGISYAKIKMGERFEELTALNNYSIGIEIVNTGRELFSQQQMESVKELLLYLMKRFKIRKDMIFSHSEIGTILYSKAFDSYVLRKVDPHRLFDWELLERNNIGLHINNRIESNEAKRLMDKVLYKMGDKNTDILKLKERLNRFFYKIRPWNDKEGKIVLPDDRINYSNEFDESFMWVVYQFSIHNLPIEIRKDLPLKLEQQDVFPKLIDKYRDSIYSEFNNLYSKIHMLVKPHDLNEKDYKYLLTSLTNYEQEVSRKAFNSLIYKMEIYYNSDLRYDMSLLYGTFKSNILNKIDILQQDILSLESLEAHKITEVSNLIAMFKENISSEFQKFEQEYSQQYIKVWKKEFMPFMKKQIKWTKLHEEILKYLEKSKLQVNEMN
ncbi:N-acetylmuramoyl-L-alanine amidase [Candidatus Tisiphia endosymbiont of Xenochironomus xenolabis]|uniref:N-acetylmuramoyl-L-alanine amidase n=1 Tax=unclassified Candidatus Tisiphia TaxID=2996318 RepID=UPI0035C8B798